MSGEEDEISGEVGGRWRRIPRVNYSGKEELEKQHSASHLQGGGRRRKKKGAPELPG